jgi:hypothetical protein
MDDMLLMFIQPEKQRTRNKNGSASPKPHGVINLLILPSNGRIELRHVELILLAIRFLILVFSGHKQVALENIALRHQLAVFTREKKRPRLRDRDRLFWMA